MLYRSVEKRIRRKSGRCALDEWVTDCRRSPLTKAMALNLICEFYYESLSQTVLLELAEALDQHLQSKNRNIDPVDRIKGAVSGHPRLWSSPASDMSGVARLSRVITSDDIVQTNNRLNGTAPSETTHVLSDSEVQASLDEFAGYLSSREFDISFGGRSGILWFAPTNEIESSVWSSAGGHSTGVVVRDLLGLHTVGYLVEVQFGPDMTNQGVKPNVFHSNCSPYWSPRANIDGWGMTLNLASLADGVRESVRRAAAWPDCVLNRLGSCSFYREMNWDQVTETRLSHIRRWAATNRAVLDDLDYVTGKWV
jgi:hypothetical protein